MERPVRVCIIHDHQLFSDVVTAQLQQEEAISLMEPAPDLGSIGLTDHSTPFDVVLIDTATVRMNTVHVIGEIKRTCPGVKVIVLGLEYLEEDVLRFIEAGASGYVLKNASYAELLHTIKAVHQGQTPCSPRVAALVFSRIAALAQARSQFHHVPRVSLTQREREVLQLLARGCRNGEIAHQLGVALETVKRHVANIFKKFQVHGRRAVIQRAHEQGMLTEAGVAQLVGISGPSSWR